MGNFVSKENADSLFGKVGERLELRPKTFTGSHDEWNNLTSTEQAEYQIVNFNDDYSPSGVAPFSVLADEFDSAESYAIGDMVTHNEKLYKFVSAHTADDPWDISEVSETTVETAIDTAISSLGAASTKNYTDVVRQGNHDLVESNAVANAIDQALSSIYTPRGDIACADLTSSLLIEANIGNVYETSDAGTTSALFIQGADHPIIKGDNVGIIKAGQNAIMFNLMGNAFDLHNYQKKELDTPLTIGGVSRTTVESALGALNTPHEVIVATAVASGSKTFKDALYELLPAYSNLTEEQRVNSYLKRGAAKYTFISGDNFGGIYSHIHVQGTDLLVARTLGIGSNSQGNNCWYREAQARTSGLSFPDYSSTIMSSVDMYLCYSY